jgi:hypothetical protein
MGTARGRPGALLIVVLALTVAACTTSDAAATAVVRPVDVTLVSNGGADPPSGEFVDLVVSCQEDLNAGRDAACSERVQAAENSSDPEARAAAGLFEHLIKINGGDYSQLRDPAVRELLDSLPSGSRQGFTEMYYRTQAVGFAATGDEQSERRARGRALAVAPPERQDEIRSESETVAPAGDQQRNDQMQEDQQDNRNEQERQEDQNQDEQDQNNEEQDQQQVPPNPAPNNSPPGG